MNNFISTENLIIHINKYLMPWYELVVMNIPEKYIKAGKSDKCVELRKTSSDEIYIDWNYDDFNISDLTYECNIKFGVDRDYEPIMRGEFEDMAKKITLALNKLNS